MGQRTGPIEDRLGIIRGWESNWYGGSDYGNKLAEDDKIRKYVQACLSKASVAHVIIGRTFNLITVTITATRPGIIVGKGGQEVDKLKEEPKEVTGKDIQVNIFEVKRPEPGVALVAAGIANQIKGYVPYKCTIKMAMASTMRISAEGIKIMISDRLSGAEMARSESSKGGRIPLPTSREDTDYAIDEAHTTYGRMDIEVRIMKGETYGKRELSPLVGMTKRTSGGNFSSRSGDKPVGAPKKARRKE